MIINYLLQLLYTEGVGDYLTGGTLLSPDRLLLERERKRENMISLE